LGFYHCQLVKYSDTPQFNTQPIATEFDKSANRVPICFSFVGITYTKNTTATMLKQPKCFMDKWLRIIDLLGAIVAVENPTILMG
jgi:hypothetical protein